MHRRGFLAGVLGLAAMAAAGGAQAADTVLVFAAASLKNALDEVGKAYDAARGTTTQFSYGASSALARQIEQGAPADLFISADTDWMDYVAGKRLIVTASRRNLLTNHLALIAPASSRVTLRIGRGMNLVGALGAEGRLAVAGPEVPAGKYARASLAALGVLSSVGNRLASAENVRAARALVARGEAPLGSVYDTDAKAEPKVRIVGLLPDSSHPPIIYPAALTARTRNLGAAAFLSYLNSEAAAAIFRRNGFIVLPRT